MWYFDHVQVHQRDSLKDNVLAVVTGYATQGFSNGPEQTPSGFQGWELTNTVHIATRLINVTCHTAVVANALDNLVKPIAVCPPKTAYAPTFGPVQYHQESKVYKTSTWNVASASAP